MELEWADRIDVDEPSEADNSTTNGPSWARVPTPKPKRKPVYYEPSTDEEVEAERKGKGKEKEVQMDVEVQKEWYQQGLGLEDTDEEEELEDPELHHALKLSRESHKASLQVKHYISGLETELTCFRETQGLDLKLALPKGWQVHSPATHQESLHLRNLLQESLHLRYLVQESLHLQSLLCLSFQMLIRHHLLLDRTPFQKST